MEVNIDISQLTVLDNFFKDLSATNQKKVFTAAYRKAAKPLIAAVKATVPVKRGNLFRSIGTVANTDGVSILVGARLAGVPKNKGWHGHFTENGTVERFKRRQSKRKGKNIKQRSSSAGQSTGRVIAQHWFENAYNATQEQVFDSIAQEWYNEIDRLIQRTVKKIKK